jgi:hypothetical protein
VEINPDYISIKNYLEGKLSPQESHDLEKRALDDPFLADAIEGFSISKIPADSQLSILQRRLEEHIALQQEKKSSLNFSWQRLSIAAAAGLLFITAGILFWMYHFQQKQSQVSQGVEVNISEVSPQLGNRYSQKLSERVTVYFTDLAGTQPQPESGWKSYGEYFDKNLQTGNSTKGDVIVGFHISSSGKAEDIKIIKGFNQASEAEAIHLIKDGPSWIYTGSDKASEIRISFKF